ncbi:hypothetical protein [Hyphomicrobium sp. LHD-15]|uniref:hypothetical protein n=1 Tax=Hyphomicrobium sp. LHD-15 TaxID=3072142 RepID=UPI00280DF4F0|nr:hypothetical protein [Hyphomicrobium sp. LHD-15]MDQ8700118.1 hypothetical protein [Hyphomicrobium sp. LHD-15]
MKSTAFADRLEEVAELFAAGQATSASTALKTLVPIFRVLPAKSVTDVTKKLTEHDFPSASFMQARVETIARLLPALEKFTAAIASKAIAADFAALTALLEKHKNASLDQFVAKATEALAHSVAGKTKPTKAAKTLRTDLVEQYNKRLEEALGDDPGFRQIVSQLQHDAEMTSGEMAALAKRFAFSTAKGRDQALKKIMSRHQDLMIARAASRATAGRIAG